MRELEEKKKIISKDLIAVIIFAIATVLLIALLIIFGGGEKVKEKTYYEFFDTVSSIKDYSKDSDGDFKKNCGLIEEKLSYYHKLFDIYNEYGGIVNLATVNRLAPTEAVKVDPELIDFLLYSVSMHELTDGYVNVAMGSVLSIWHDYRTRGTGVPTRAELEEANLHTDIGDLEIDKENLTVRFSDPEMRLDVGAIAKGYAAEKCAELLKSLGVSSYVIDLGGNLRAIGEKPDGGTWRTGIQNPDAYSDEPYAYYLDVSDTSVVTSGDYQRYYVVDGKTYHHIINKDTLFPAEYYSSVTVVTENSGLADALSTALFNMPKAKAISLLDTLDGVSAVWVYPDGRVETYGFEE